MSAGKRRLSPFEMRVRHFGRRHRVEARSLLSGCTGVTETDLSSYLSCLDGIETVRTGMPVLALIIQTTSYPNALGVALAQPASREPNRWELRVLAIDSRSRRRGLGGTLLEAVESEVRGRGARRLSVAVPSVADHPSVGAFLRARGYREEFSPAQEANLESHYSKEL